MIAAGKGGYKCENGDAGIRQTGRDGLCPYDTLEPKLENPEPSNMVKLDWRLTGVDRVNICDMS